MIEQVSHSEEERRLFPSLNMPAWRTVYLFFLLILALSYWLFVWFMERIDWAVYQYPIQLPIQLPQVIIGFSTLFLPRVLRHFIPVVLGWLIAYEMAANLIYYLYNLPDRRMARTNLNLLGNPTRSKSTPVEVTAQTLEAQRKDNAVLQTGGPGRIHIPAGQVAVTEHNGRYYRLLDAGTHALDSFEYIYAVLDLRPQQRTQEEVKLQSREGLQVWTDVSVTFRISKGGNVAAPTQPHPFDSDAVRKLAYAQMNLPNGKVGSWEGMALGTVIALLSKIAFNFSLDELLQDSETEIGTHLTIRQNVEREARKRLAEQGIELIRVRIGHFQFPEDVTSQHIAHWTTYWESLADMAETEGEAVALEEMERAQAEAEIDMIRAIVEGIHQAKLQGFQSTTDEVVALRLVEVLEKLARQSQADIQIPQQMLPQIQNLQKQLLQTGDLEDEEKTVPPPIINSNNKTD